jgi:hypothetical protein
VAALLGSTYSFYAVNLRVEDDLRLRLIDSGMAGIPPEQTVSETIAVFNAGNRPAIVLEAYLTITAHVDGRDEWGIVGCGFSDKKNTLIIEPHQIQLLTLQVCQKNAYDRLENGTRMTSRDGKVTWRFFVLLHLVSVDSGGTIHRLDRLPVAIMNAARDHGTGLETYAPTFRAIRLFHAA